MSARNSVASELSASEDLRHELEQLVNFCPLPLKYSSKEETQILPPPAFYDRHLDAGLRLRHVRLIPSLHHDLAHVFQRELSADDLAGLTLPSADKYFEPDPLRRTDSVRTGLSIGANYTSNLGSISQKVASYFCLLRGSPHWPYLYSWKRRSYQISQDYPSFVDSYSPTLRLDSASLFPKEVSESLDPEVLKNLQHIQNLFPKMAVWQMFALTPQVQQIFEEMEKVSIPPIQPGVLDRMQNTELDESVSYEPCFDSDDVFVTSLLGDCPTSQALRTAIALETKQARRSLRIARKTNVVSRSSAENITVDRREGLLAPGANTPATATSIILHAWKRAVEADSTFIVFYAGNFERIGIRHRKSQTLFLSNLIHVNPEEESLYGALHVGLHMCIIRDLLNRIPHYIGEQSSSRRSRLRSGERRSNKKPAQPDSQTRRWTRRATMQERQEADSFEEVLQKTMKINLFLLRFHCGILSTSAPVKLFRLGKSLPRSKAFKPQEYVNIVITGYCGFGATGDVHRAKIHLSNGRFHPIECKAVVKLAFSYQQRKKLRREFEIYQYMASKRVVGIPHILGIYQDIETRALAMLMQDVGEPVFKPPHKIIHKNGTSWIFTEGERTAFVRALSSIHSSGVRHRDIRPENLLLTGSGQAYIIDFDKALMNASEESRKEEMAYLEELLYDGQYTAPHDVPSLEAHSEGWREPSGLSSPR